MTEPGNGLAWKTAFAVGFGTTLTLVSLVFRSWLSNSNSNGTRPGEFKGEEWQRLEITDRSIIDHRQKTKQGRTRRIAFEPSPALTKVIRESGPPYSSSSQHLYEVVYRIAQADLERMGNSHSATCYFCDREIRGTMYICTECSDVQLCAECEQEDRHSKSHLLYKVDRRVPRHLRLIALKGDMSSWTSDDNTHVHEVEGAVAPRLDYDELEGLKRGLDDVFGERHNISSAEIDALYEQFKCLLDIPHGAFGAISKEAFRSMLLTRYSVDTILFDFLFKVYDGDEDGLVSFSDYIRGISVIIHGSSATKAHILAGQVQGKSQEDAKDYLRKLLLSYVDMSKNIFADAGNLQQMSTMRPPLFYGGRGHERRKPRREELSTSVFQSDLLWDTRDEIDTWAAYYPMPEQPQVGIEMSMLWDLSVEELLSDIFSDVGDFSIRAFEHVLATNVKVASIVTSLFDAGII